MSLAPVHPTALGGQQRSCGVNCARPREKNQYAEILTPETCDCDVIWKKGLCKGDQIKMRSRHTKVGPERRDWVLHRDRETHEEESHVETEQRLELRWPRSCGHHQKLEEARGTLPWGLQRERGPADTLIWDFQPQSCESTQFCCFKPQRLWYSVTAVLGN